MGDLAGVRARLPYHSVGISVPTGAPGPGSSSGQTAVRFASVRLRGATSDVAVAAGAVVGAALPAGGIW